MPSAPVLEDDARRVASIRSSEILSSLTLDAFDAIADLVASICQSPVARVTLVDGARTHGITHLGVDAVEEIPRDVSFCLNAIDTSVDLTIVSDAREDPRFRHDPLVVSEPYVRFFAGMPLVSSDGFVLGTLCVLDVVPHELSVEARSTLHLARHCVVSMLEERRTSLCLAAALAEQRVSAGRLALLESVAINAHEGVMVLETQASCGALPVVVFANASALRLTGWLPERLPASIDRELWFAIAARDGTASLESIVASNAPHVTEAHLRCGGDPTLVELTFSPIIHVDPQTASRWLVLIRDLSDRNRAETVQRRAETIAARNGELAAEIERRRDVERRLSFAVAHDSLTDLPNRRYFVERLRARFAVSRRRADGIPFGVMFVDIDRFKAVNDTLGHMRGDELLVTIARRLQGCVRVQDVVARLGGDEFTILIDAAVDRTTIATLAERIGRAIAGPCRLGRTDVSVSASIGIVLDDGTHASAEDLLRDADIAMFHAKARGRNRHEFFREALRARVVNEARLEKSLRDALERDDFRLVYAPIVALGDPTFPVLGFEALLRWNSPYQGELGTSGIIAAAEKNGLIVRIGDWAIAQACRQVARWKMELPARARIPYVMVDISPRHIVEREFGDRFESAIAASGIAATDIVLVFTENAMLHEDENVIATVARLRALGVRFYLDEFGTGCASLSDLRRFAVDWLKIDRSFVGGQGSGLADEAIVDGIIALAHRLGIRTVAAGVETQEQIERLIALGCECAQGVAFGPPLEAELATEILTRAWRTSAPS